MLSSGDWAEAFRDQGDSEIDFYRNMIKERNIRYINMHNEMAEKDKSIRYRLK